MVKTSCRMKKMCNLNGLMGSLLPNPGLQLWEKMLSRCASDFLGFRTATISALSVINMCMLHEVSYRYDQLATWLLQIHMHDLVADTWIAI